MDETAPHDELQRVNTQITPPDSGTVPGSPSIRRPLLVSTLAMLEIALAILIIVFYYDAIAMIIQSREWMPEDFWRVLGLGVIALLAVPLSLSAIYLFRGREWARRGAMLFSALEGGCCAVFIAGHRAHPG